MNEVLSETEPARIRLKIFPIRVALTPEQIQTHDLPSSIEAKATSTNYKAFVAKHGTRAVELDAMPRGVLQAELRRSIESVIDLDVFAYEQRKEREDAAHLHALRQASILAISGEVSP